MRLHASAVRSLLRPSDSCGHWQCREQCGTYSNADIFRLTRNDSLRSCFWNLRNTVTTSAGGMKSSAPCAKSQNEHGLPAFYAGLVLQSHTQLEGPKPLLKETINRTRAKWLRAILNTDVEVELREFICYPISQAIRRRQRPNTFTS